MATSVTVKTIYSEVTVAVEDDDMTFGEFYERVAEPAMAHHYSHGIINKYMSEE